MKGSPSRPRPSGVASRVALGFSATLLVALIIAIVSLRSLRTVITEMDQIVNRNSQDVIDSSELWVAAERLVSTSRGYYITRNAKYLESYRKARKEVAENLEQLRKRVDTPASAAYLDRIYDALEGHQHAVAGTVSLMEKGVSQQDLREAVVSQNQPERDAVENAIHAFDEYLSTELKAAHERAEEDAEERVRLVTAIGIIGTAIATLLSIILTRTIGRLHAAAHDATARREEILQIVSHDLRNPLTSIGMSASLVDRLVREGSTPERISRAIGAIKLASENANRLVADLLDMAKIDAGHFSVERAPCQPQQILSRIREIFEPLAGARNVSLTVESADQLPAIECDSERIHQALSNLIGNAIKFTGPGGVITVRAELSEAKADGKPEIDFLVRDSGLGIPSKDLPRIFDRFWQSPRASSLGAGLGLSIVKGIVEQHRGEIRVASEPGQGTEFRITLPLKAA
jgi:signal transduction histidine kinase